MTRNNPTPRLSSISAVFPAYNDYATIPSMIITAIIAMRQLTDEFEVIVVNDGSQDDTRRVLDDIGPRIPELRVAHHPHNLGYGCALKTGFSMASKDWIFYTDGDAQYNPLEMARLVDALKPGIDIVNGYKISRGDGLLRKLIGRTYHNLVRLAFGFQLKDVNCDFRLIRRSAFEAVSLESEGGTIGLEMVKKFQAAGYQFVEVPVHHFPRPHGVSQFLQKRHLITTAKNLIALWIEIVWKKRGRN